MFIRSLKENLLKLIGKWKIYDIKPRVITPMLSLLVTEWICELECAVISLSAVRDSEHGSVWKVKEMLKFQKCSEIGLKFLYELEYPTKFVDSEMQHNFKFV